MGTSANLAAIFGYKTAPQRQVNKIVTINAPVFKSFGRDIMVSDIVATAIHRIAEEVSKCSLRSVVEKHNPHRVENREDELNRIFDGWVNPYATRRAFLYKVAYMLVKNCNCFIYPQYDEVPVGTTGKVKRIYKAFHVIEASEVTLYYEGDEFRIELRGNGCAFDMPYKDIIHLRHKFGANQFLGGDSSGNFDARNLLGNLQTVKTIKDAIPKSLESSLSLKGVLSMKTVASLDKKEVSRDEFEQHLFTSKLGIVATDYESDFTPVNIQATDIPTGIMDFLNREILCPFGVSLPILIGKFTDEEHNAFYQTTIEGILEEIAQVFTAVLFTDREIAYGNKIKVYDRLVQNLTIDKRIQIAQLVIPSGHLDNDEVRELLGYEPNGEPTRVSLNFVEKSIANSYQLQTLANGKIDDGGKK